MLSTNRHFVRSEYQFTFIEPSQVYNSMASSQIGIGRIGIDTIARNRSMNIIIVLTQVTSQAIKI